jgi:hypothetical protein
LRPWTSALETSTASSLHCRASTLEASTASALHCRASALETSAASALHCRASALETSTTSAAHCRASALGPSALAASNVLIRPLAEWTVLTFGEPGVAWFYAFWICTHSWFAGHSSSPSLPAAASAVATSRLGKSLRSQNRHCEHYNCYCFDSCLFHFLSLSIIFRSTVYLGPVSGSFCMDSGAGRKKVTPESRFSGKYPGNYVSGRELCC